jgi:hypothetical protein
VIRCRRYSINFKNNSERWTNNRFIAMDNSMANKAIKAGAIIKVAAGINANERSRGGL